MHCRRTRVSLGSVRRVSFDATPLFDSMSIACWVIPLKASGEASLLDEMLRVRSSEKNISTAHIGLWIQLHEPANKFK